MGASNYLDNDDELPEQRKHSTQENLLSPQSHHSHYRNQTQNFSHDIHHTSSYNPIPAMRERESLLISSRIGKESSSRDINESNLSFSQNHIQEDAVHSSTPSLRKLAKSQPSQPFSSSSSVPRTLDNDRDYYRNFTNRLQKVQTATSRVENAHIDKEVEPMGAEEREDLIITLQAEVARLKSKLSSIITSAESTITDAQFAQDDMQAHYAAECDLLSEKNQILQEENAKLRVMLKESNENLAVERDLLLRSVKYMERLRLRGKALNKNLDRKTLVRDLKEYREKDQREAALRRSVSIQSRVW